MQPELFAEFLARVGVTYFWIILIVGLVAVLIRNRMTRGLPELRPWRFRFVLLLGVGFCAAVFAVGVVSSMVVARYVDWQPFTSSEHGFTVTLPELPRTQRILRLAPQGELHGASYVVNQGWAGVVYTVRCVELTVDPLLDPEQAMSEVFAQLLREEGVAPEDTEPVAVDERAGVGFAVPDPRRIGVVRGRAFREGTRAWLLLASPIDPKRPDPNWETFIHSFTLTP